MALPSEFIAGVDAASSGFPPAAEQPAPARDSAIRPGAYTEVEYRQFHPSNGFRRARVLVGWLTRLFAWPLAFIARLSPSLFITASEFVSLLPYVFGVVFREEFYRFALRACGRNVVIEFGTVFLTRDVSLGSHILIGRYNTIHHCDFGDYVLTAEGCAFLSGSRYHRFERTDVPIARQGGQKTRIEIGRDTWIGAHAVVMASVGSGAVVGAGAVVTRPVEAMTIVTGNPARPVRRRTPAGPTP